MLLDEVSHAQILSRPMRPKDQTKLILMPMTAHSNIRLHDSASRLSFVQMSCRRFWIQFRAGFEVLITGNGKT